MKPIESYPDKRRCEMCGALRVDDDADSGIEHEASEVVRRLAFVADKSPSLAILMIHYIAGQTERDIAASLGITHQAVHRKITNAKKAMLPIKKLK